MYGASPSYPLLLFFLSIERFSVMPMFTCQLQGPRSLGPIVIDAVNEGDAQAKFRDQIQCGWNHQEYKFVATIATNEETVTDQQRLEAAALREEEIRRAGQPAPEVLDDEELDDEELDI